jgi:hypothetical protein
VDDNGSNLCDLRAVNLKTATSHDLAIMFSDPKSLDKGGHLFVAARQNSFRISGDERLDPWDVGRCGFTNTHRWLLTAKLAVTKTSTIAQ